MDMDSNSLIFSFFLIFTGAAVLATASLYARQPLIVGYIVLGIMLGPSGAQMISDTKLLNDISHTGIIFLLFLLGLDMQPAHLFHMLRKTAFVGLMSSLVFAVIGYGCALAFDFSQIESLIIGSTMIFSSTIIGIKLLPTTVLHHKHTGELLISLLLLQDLLAILLLLLLQNGAHLSKDYQTLLVPLGILPLLVIGAFLSVKLIILPLMTRFDRYHEYLFLVAIGWCLGVAELAQAIGLSVEIGAFIAGISMATSPISQYITINLKPLRDFFLILFFFSTGASFHLSLLAEVIFPVLALSSICLFIKPPVFRYFLRKVSEKRSTAWEVGTRLGQNSEFSILIASVASHSAIIGSIAAHTIQATVILTLLISSYIVVFNYESSIAVSDKLRRD